MIFLGVDPGTINFGYGVVRKNGGLTFVDCGKIGDGKNQVERLTFISGEFKKLVEYHKPDVMGIEKVFFSKNKSSALLVAECRGVAISIAGVFGIPVFEYSPNEVKSVVAGDGRCDKKTLAHVVALTLGVENPGWGDDSSDALALAIRASFEPTTRF